MTQIHFGKTYSGSAPENYERYFVPAIGAPLARDLIKIADLQMGERVLDVACGTGVVTRLAAQEVGATGSVTGLDVNPGMIAVARTATPSGMNIEWREGSAESMPFPDASFDAVLCQMGLQFIPDKASALTESLRVLVPGGRLIINLPGPIPPAFAILAETFARDFGPAPAGFLRQVFSLYDTGKVQSLLGNAGFSNVTIMSDNKQLRLPAPHEFLWQFVHSTPLEAAVASADEQQLASLEREVLEKWQQFVDDGAMIVQVHMVTATGRKV